MTDTLFTTVVPAPPHAAAGPRPAPRVFTVMLRPGIRLLNANQRIHYKRRAEYTAALRGAAMEAVSEHAELTKALADAKPGPLFQRAHILAVLHPADKQRRDPANWYPSFKAAVDGLVDAGLLEDDDHTRVLGPDMRLGSKVAGSQLVLHVTELAPGEQWPNLGAVTP